MNVAKLDASFSQTYHRMHEGANGSSLIESFMAKRPSVEERVAMGKALRAKVPRSSHAEWKPRPDRPDPVSILEKQNATRIPKLVPVRYARMLVSPFTFLRGSAAVMADDLSGTPVSGLPVAACGDMHVSNFGVYASAERNLIFAINDFDETPSRPVGMGPQAPCRQRGRGSALHGRRPGAGRGGGARMRAVLPQAHAALRRDGLPRRSGTSASTTTPCSRRSRHGCGAPPSASWTTRAPRGTSQSLEKLTEEVDGEHRLIEDVPLIVRETHNDGGLPAREALDEMLRAYIESLDRDRRALLSRYRIVDGARKVVGVGSVGTSCWVVLLQGVDADDPLFLQVKQAQQSVLAPYVSSKLHIANQGQRVVVGQRLTQGSPDIFLGWGERRPDTTSTFASSPT